MSRRAIPFNPTNTSRKVYTFNECIARDFFKPTDGYKYASVGFELLKFVVPTNDDIPWILKTAKDRNLLRCFWQSMEGSKVYQQLDMSAKRLVTTATKSMSVGFWGWGCSECLMLGCLRALGGGGGQTSDAQ